MQFSTAVRNAWLDVTESTIGASPILRIRSGAAPANCGAADTGTVLATLTLPADWMAAANSAIMSASVPKAILSPIRSIPAMMSARRSKSASAASIRSTASATISCTSGDDASAARVCRMYSTPPPKCRTVSAHAPFVTAPSVPQ